MISDSPNPTNDGITGVNTDEVDLTLCQNGFDLLGMNDKADG
ncbi:hypothetical protein BH10PSE12_BH10PSE12_23660 [soil metagenome]